MKLKIFSLILFCFFNFSTTSSAALDVKKKEDIEISKKDKLREARIHSTQNRKWYQKKRKKRKVKKRRFRLRDLFNWKKTSRKGKKIEPLTDKKTSTSALLSAIFAIAGLFLLILFSSYYYSIIPIAFAIFNVLAFILGIKGLREIKRNPDELEGKTDAWIGLIISGFWIAIFIFLLIFIELLYLD